MSSDMEQATSTPPLFTVVRVPDVAVRKDSDGGDEYAAYKIVVTSTSKGDSWTLWRRWSDMIALNESMRDDPAVAATLRQHVDLPKFEAHWWFFFVSKMDRGFLNERGAQMTELLQAWVRVLRVRFDTEPPAGPPALLRFLSPNGEPGELATPHREHARSSDVSPLRRLTSLFGHGERPPKAPGFLEGVVADVLQKVLGAFVRGIDKQSLQLSVWDGDVKLHGLELRTEVLDALPLPVKVGGSTSLELQPSLSPSHPLTFSPSAAHPLTLSPSHPLTRSPAHPSPGHPLTREGRRREPRGGPRVRAVAQPARPGANRADGRSRTATARAALA